MPLHEKPSPYDVLMHHGIKGQKWGVRRFQDKSGRLTSAGKERYGSDKSPSKKTADSLIESMGSKKASNLVGSDADEAIAYVAVLATYTATMLAVPALIERSQRKNRRKELEELNRDKEIKSFSECPKLSKKMKAEDSMKVTNPDYPDLGSTMNCSFCTSAMALREKGYNVKAAKLADGMFTDDLFKTCYNSPTVKVKARTQTQVTDALSKEGDGAYGNLSVMWKYGGGHSVFWKNEGGRTRIYDGQSGDEITSSSSTLKAFMDSCDLRRTMYNRLDNCEPTDYALATVESNAKKK